MFSHRNIKIEVNARGEFLARVKDVQITETSLKAAQDAIDKAVTAAAKSRALNLKVVCMATKNRQNYLDKGEPPRVLHAILTGINRTTGDLTLSGVPAEHSVNYVLPDTTGCIAELERHMDIQQKARASERHRDAFALRSGRNGRVAAENYEGLLASLEEQYSKSKYEHES